MDYMDRFLLGVLAVIFLALLTAGALWINYNYQWARQCANARGVMLENSSGSRICVRSPVEMLPIAARPW